MAKYTFLLPAYKGRFLDEMLRSIQGQTYTDFKVIISDDCSPEDLRSICEPYLSDPRFTYRRNDENMGSKSLVSHWNLLVSICDTDYLIMASDDDIYESQFLAEIDALVQLYPQVDLLKSRAKTINNLDQVCQKDSVTCEFESQVDFLYGQYCLQRIGCVGNYVFKSSVLKAFGGFVDFPLAWGSDEATVMKMSKNGVCITPSVSFVFRMSGANISSGSNRLKTMTMMDNISFFERFLDNVHTDGSLLQSNRLNECRQMLIKQRIRMILLGFEFLSFSEFRKLYAFLKERGEISGFLDRLHFVYTWLKASGKR